MAGNQEELPGWVRLVSRLLSFAAAAGIFMLMALVFVSVFFRYVLNSPIIATEDMMALLLGITIFTAFPLVTSQRGHISVELLTGLFAGFPVADRVRRILIDIGIIGVVLFMAKKLFDQAVRYQDRETGSIMMDWPLYPFIYSFAGLVVLAAVLFAMRALKDRGRGDSGGDISL